eukprot:TRINITY_DN6318_c0_g1_i2.p1 TRINITY_DN6318_c0_g1~~TRINITY_DN6318_c0_g1_i2.p1  ORF type:complete len:302 (+),score=50.86 TRINITY_DN6318_c0_g1_i2:65-970(+)
MVMRSAVGATAPSAASRITPASAPTDLRRRSTSGARRRLGSSGGRSVGNSGSVAEASRLPAASPTAAGGTRSCWPGLPSAEMVATARVALSTTVALPHTPAEYCEEADRLRSEFPEIVWQREGKPDKVSLGSRATPEDWAKYQKVCPKILEAAEKLLRSLTDQRAEVTFGDVLDYSPGQRLGWHQDNMDLTRHTFTAVLTLSTFGEGRFEWRTIEAAPDGGGSPCLGEVTSSSCPGAGNLAIHGLTCNNSLAHRAVWTAGRRVALVLFCRSPEVAAILANRGEESRLTMRYWWSREVEAAP